MSPSAAFEHREARLTDDNQPMMYVLRLFAVGVLGPLLDSAVDCTREFLKKTADSLVAAQAAGNPNMFEPVSDALSGILSKALKIDHSRHSLDTTQCATYTELISATSSKPYVLGTQMYFKDGAVSKIDTLVTTSGNWLFNATNTLNWASKEDWSAISEGKTRLDGGDPGCGGCVLQHLQ
ncbi:hypothetical protein VTI74DRAFT_7266 [Chaetomium olivicolor]